MINNRTRGFNKNPNFEKLWKSHKNAWVYAWKHENKSKGKGIKVLPALGEENLAKRLDENDKNLRLSLDQVVWREKR